MKVKIIDFLLSIGKICDEHSDSCNNCPLCVHEEKFNGCFKDDISNPKHAKMIKDITLKYMKDRRVDR